MTIIPGGFGQSQPMRYSNGTQIGASQWDIRIDFQYQTGDAAGPHEAVAAIVMSPLHAKAFTAVLNQVIQTWEAQWGEMPSVETLMAQRAGGDSSGD